MRLKWFKHFNTACSGSTIRTLWDSGHYSTVAFYWMILELISRWEQTDERGKVDLTLGILVRETGWKSDKVWRELVRLESDTLSIKITNQTDLHSICIRSAFDLLCKRRADLSTIVTICSNNWLELQENRGGKRLAKKDQNIVKTPIEVRSKKLDKNITKRNDDDRISDEMLESIYQEYPRKQDKLRSFARCRSVLKITDLEDFKLAVNNYSQHCKHTSLEKKYIKLFSTFVGTSEVPAWRDWVNPPIAVAPPVIKTGEIEI